MFLFVVCVVVVVVGLELVKMLAARRMGRGLGAAAIASKAFCFDGCRFFHNDVKNGSSVGMSGVEKDVEVRKTVDDSEVEKFSQMDWAGPEGLELSLMHPTRVHAIEKYLHSGGRRGVHGLRLLDVGCGGGLLSRSLLDYGAKVVSIDAVENNVKATEQVCEKYVGSGRFQAIHCTVEELLEERGPQSFDGVISLEVLEHVKDPSLFIDCCCKLTNDSLVLSTINRTMKSYLLAIVAAEYIARKIPRGTHDWNKFVQPREIETTVHANGLHTDEIIGLFYNPIFGSWHESRVETDVNYMYFASRSKGGKVEKTELLV